MGRHSTAAIAGLVSCTLGCSSAYIPRPGPRLSLIMDSGTLAYARDGKKYEGGLFGGEIEEAVRGNAQAEEFARQYKTGTEAGFFSVLVGAVGIVGGTVVTGLEEGPSENRSAPVAGVVTVGAGLLLYMTGLIVMLNAAPHLYDAINAYNDGLPVPAAP